MILIRQTLYNFTKRNKMMFESIFRRKDEEKNFKQEGRMPPGQSLTNRFPVLHYGSVPGFNPATWFFRSPMRGKIS